jgi:23S rRNA pseudouridine955/2504/2580 synthase
LKQLTINKDAAGQRFDKYLKRLFYKAPPGFVYKMLRKKNIVLNGRKASGDLIISEGDEVTFFLSDETFCKFKRDDYKNVKFNEIKPKIIAETNDLLIINKPAGLLSQKSKPEDRSVNDFIIAYLIEKGGVTADSLANVRPAICNRLDRNTSGIVVAGKTLKGLRAGSELFRNRELGKYYLCLTVGELDSGDWTSVSAFIDKDERSNKSEIIINNNINANRREAGELVPIKMEYRFIAAGEGVTLAEVKLLTGKSHQIRAYFASLGHPLEGDIKYGAKTSTTFGYYLHSYKLVMPEKTDLEELSGKTLIAPLPDKFSNRLRGIKWQHGAQEVCGVLT